MEKIKALLQTIPEISDWTDLLSVFDRTQGQPHPDWEIPLLVTRALGVPEAVGQTGAAAVASMQLSIMLVDDILDDDPRGEHLRRGVGKTANMALAYQAAAYRVLDFAPIAAAQKGAAAECLSQMSLATAYGQNLDVQNLSGEENYWRVVEAKSTPFYRAAYQLGGILGDAGDTIIDGLKALGSLIGEMIQIEDDLEDAFQQPANADWFQGRNNLLILYAGHADHDEREIFTKLLPEIADPEKLELAQQILVRCGATSYAAYHLIERYREARKLVQDLHLPHPEPLERMLSSYADRLVHFLQLGGMNVSKALLNEL